MLAKVRLASDRGDMDNDKSYEAKHHKTVCVDFDGVLAQHRPGQKNIGRPLQAGLDLLRTLKKQGFEIVILTARTEEHWGAIWTFLAVNKVKNLVSDVTNIKPPAVKYYDDRAIHWTKNREI